MKYEVGQVVYLLNHSTLTIVPALVVEEIVRKSIKDQTKEYIIELPGESKKRIILENVDDRIFNDVGKLRDHMLENTRQSVEKLIKNAIEKKEVFFGANTLDLTSEEKAKEVKTKILETEKESDKKTKKHVQNDVKSVIMNGNTKTKEAKWK